MYSLVVIFINLTTKTMTKYKLIKEYPGSPKLGILVSKAKFHMHYNYNGGDFNSSLRISDVENHPEYWELVVEKDYEILSYYAKNISGKGDDYIDPTYIWKQKTNGKWARFYNEEFHTTPYTTDQINNHNGYCIHSVKRLSDSEIFTVGDKVNSRSFENQTIISFMMFQDGFSIELSDVECDLDCLKKLKQPLFTTEDGVDIFEGDKFYCVSTPYKWEIIKRIGGDGLAIKEEWIRKRCFLSKEKAEEYILMNKPCLSINDVLKTFVKANINYETQERRLIQLLKQKL
jgi:hypothetical protein